MYSNNNQFKCTLIDKKGNVFIGWGENLDKAIEEARRQIDILNTPQKGPGMWEPQKFEKKDAKKD